MAWPFVSVSAPNLDSGFVSVPQVSTLVPTVSATSTPVWLLGAYFANPTARGISVQVTDGSGNVIVPLMEVPAGGMTPVAWEFMPATGLMWLANTAGLIGKAWGYI